jgi:hypothetical protein
MKILKIASLDCVKKQSEIIKKSVIENGAIILRGIFDPNDMKTSLNFLYNALDGMPILGTTQGTRESVRKNTLKWSVGGSTGAQKGNARFMLTAYNPIFEDDIYGFRSNFIRLIQIRDAIRGDQKTTNDDSLSYQSFNACRFQVYPRGGGFMLGHRDYVAEQASLQQNAPLLQLLLFVTKRGVDFMTGGAYLVHDGQKIDIENLALPGDIVIYDGRSHHGVDDVDSEVPLDTTQIRGRVVALVTIYQ